MYGLIMMTIGSIGICFATGMEIVWREPIYAIMMKCFPLLFAIGVCVWQRNK